MKWYGFVSFLFVFVSPKSFCQWNKLKEGSKLVYAYTLTKKSDDSTSLFKVSYILRVDQVIPFFKTKNNKLIVLSRFYDPFLNYSQGDDCNGLVTIFYITSKRVFMLDASSKIINIINDSSKLLTLQNLLLNNTKKDIYNDEPFFYIDSVLIEFEPFIRIRSNDRNTSDEATSYKGFFKFYKYSGEKSLKNTIVTAPLDIYERNSFLHRTSCKLYFSNDYGIIKSNSTVYSGPQIFNINMELIRIE